MENKKAGSANPAESIDSTQILSHKIHVDNLNGKIVGLEVQDDFAYGYCPCHNIDPTNLLAEIDRDGFIKSIGCHGDCSWQDILAEIGLMETSHDSAASVGESTRVSDSFGIKDDTCRLDVRCGPRSGQGRRLVRVFAKGKEVFRDSINTDSASSRSKLISQLGTKLTREFDDLKYVHELLTKAADSSDVELETASVKDDDESKTSRSMASTIVGLTEDLELFRESDGCCYCRLPVAGHVELWPIRSGRFRAWIAQQCYTMLGKCPSGQAVADATATLEGKCYAEGSSIEPTLRVGGDLSKVILDLVNASWQVVEVDANGWRITNGQKSCFRRSNGMLELPIPIKHGDLNELREILNVDDHGWTMVVAFLIGCLHPKGPYPILMLTGEQGSAKSTCARIIRSLIDPSKAPIRTSPRNEDDLIVAANGSWIVAFDNLSFISGDLSDSLCRLATGGGLGKRKLYTDGDVTLFDLKRPVIVTAIEELANRPDLLDRSLIVNLKSIDTSSRKTESEIELVLDRIRPRVLGCLLDAVASAIRNLPKTKIEQLPRMADFALWVCAAAESLGWSEEFFLEEYELNRHQAIDSAVSGSEVATALIRFIEHRGTWQGSYSDLLALLTDDADDATKRTRMQKSSGWPNSPRALSGQLRRLAPVLRTQGVDLNFDGPRRKLTITKHVESTVQTVRQRGDQHGLHGSHGQNHTNSNDGPIDTVKERI